MSLYALERRIAELAVERACRLTSIVSESQQTGSVSKSDHSPVTVADFGAQAVIIGALRKVFPEDPVVGEEDSSILRNDDGLRERVWKLVVEASGDGNQDEIAQIESEEQMLDYIDWGRFEGGKVKRMWALDPVDGTKGFLRGGQFAVCLALIVDSKVVVGVIGCPNLLVDPADGSSGKGMLMSAVVGEGAFSRPLASPVDSARPIKMSSLTDITTASFCESVEAGHSAHDQQAKIAQLLGITKPSVRMDSQAKYASIARGDGDIYLRLPVSATYEEKIWDHASGNLLVTEAGGIVTDMYGKPLDFSQGRTLKQNKGIVAASKVIQPNVLEVVQKVLQES
ncbi:hypothetical protein POJ06DRAFT_251569 [Lipomyces tetrasporus]|uniref:3'(2'),5'-bisphosphate nucleotidase n=1 Tax=Lipomyces tetrasporus TaxID=54092 RepID=A0AAD7QU18_9ASCO|nr:uncharacterized protein POJ06DRAFT_251569 [Lipomyces tetrasporus]KAJ8101450.1 hypothetical protein POJ06DRAFT_251569 [Lipomyces tetrasporus]